MGPPSPRKRGAPRAGAAAQLATPLCTWPLRTGKAGRGLGSALEGTPFTQRLRVTSRGRPPFGRPFRESMGAHSRHQAKDPGVSWPHLVSSGSGSNSGIISGRNLELPGPACAWPLKGSMERRHPYPLWGSSLLPDLLHGSRIRVCNYSKKICTEIK